jgi:hypothetical protein
MREDHAHAVFVLHELRVSAALNELSTLQYADAVAADDGAKTVCDHDGGGTIFNFQQLINAPLHNYFTFTVESAGRLVKQHDLGPPDKATSNTQPLPLTATELRGGHAGADQSVVAILMHTSRDSFFISHVKSHLQVLDELVRVGGSGCGRDFFLSGRTLGRRLAQGYVRLN